MASWKRIDTKIYQDVFYDGTNIEEVEDLVGTVGLKRGPHGDVRYSSGQLLAKKNSWILTQKGEVFVFESEEAIHKEFQRINGFGKEERSSFPYWFAHWCAYQMTALVLGAWKPRFLLHDFEKPWLKLVMPYKKLQARHRRKSAHHLEYGLLHGWEELDAEALVIDWECCRFTKTKAQLDARQTLEYEVSRDKWKRYEKEIRSAIEPVLVKFGL